MDIRKHQVFKVERPIVLGGGQELPIESLLVCIKGGVYPVLVTELDGRFVSMEISVTRLEGRITRASINHVPFELARACGLGNKSVMAHMPRPGDFMVLTQAIKTPNGDLKAGACVRVCNVHGLEVTIVALCGNSTLIELTLPFSTLVHAEGMPTDKGLPTLTSSLNLQAVEGQTRLAYSGRVNTPWGVIEVDCDGFHAPVIEATASALDNFHKALRTYIKNNHIPTQRLGNILERYLEHATSTYGLLSFKDHLRIVHKALSSTGEEAAAEKVAA